MSDHAWIPLAQQHPWPPRDALISQFQQCPGWEQRYRLLLQQGRELPALDPHYKTEHYRVHGCESQVWLVHGEAGGRHWFAADSDARIVKGLLALLLAAVQGRDAATIAQLDLNDYLQQLQLSKHLSPSRSNGLQAVVRQIQQWVSR